MEDDTHAESKLVSHIVDEKSSEERGLTSQNRRTRSKWLARNADITRSCTILSPAFDISHARTRID
jgi:hypothetical protein